MDRLLNRDWNQPVRYPDPAIETLDKRFAGCIWERCARAPVGRWAME